MLEGGTPSRGSGGRKQLRQHLLHVTTAGMLESSITFTCSPSLPPPAVPPRRTFIADPDRDGLVPINKGGKVGPLSVT